MINKITPRHKRTTNNCTIHILCQNYIHLQERYNTSHLHVHPVYIMGKTEPGCLSIIRCPNWYPNWYNTRLLGVSLYTHFTGEWFVKNNLYKTNNLHKGALTIGYAFIKPSPNIARKVKTLTSLKLVLIGISFINHLKHIIGVFFYSTIH